jgi:hypothetical protein
LSAAWYATSLVPKTVVAGQGVTGMLGWPLVLGGIAIVYLALLDLVQSNYQSVRTLWHKQSTGRNVSLVLSALLPVVVFGWMWFMFGSFLIGAIYLIAVLLAGLFTLRLVLRQHNLSLKFQIFARNARGVLLPVLILLLLVQFAQQAVLVAQERDPPLPRVEITWIPDASNSTKATLTEGKLLTHTESFWYVLNQGGQDAGLTAIPDDEVRHVRIGPPAKAKKHDSKKHGD